MVTPTIQLVITRYFNLLQSCVFTIDGFTFTLWDVAVGGGICSVIGFYIGKIYLFALDNCN